MITQENKDQLRFLNRFNQSKAHNVYSKKNISGQTALSNLLTIPNLVKILINSKPNYFTNSHTKYHN